MSKKTFYLLLICFFALFLRLFKLGAVPLGFTPDEASQGYSAYSLLKTGKDEWGVAWPVTSFRSFLDYKAPFQTYLMFPSIAIFGFNEFATRLPSAIFGSLAVLAIYFLSIKIFQPSTTYPSGRRVYDPRSTKLGLTAALILAISPWHIQFSRTALEVNLTSFLFPLGLYFFLQYVNSKPRTKNQKPITPLIYTAILWGLNLYSYHAAKVFLPLFIIGLLVIYRSSLSLKRIFLPAFVFLAIIFPQITGSFWGKSSSRGTDLLVLNLDNNQQKEIHQAIAFAAYRTPGFVVERMFHNKYIYAADKFIENYVSYFSPTFWFTEGGRETTYSVIPGRGLLYLWQLPFIVIALYSLVKNKSKHLGLVLLWLFVAAIPAAITKEGYRPNRAGSYAILFELLTAYGFWIIFCKQSIYKKLLLPTLFVIILSFISYQEDYYSASKTKYPEAMSYGWRQAISQIGQLSSNYSRIHIERGSQSQAFLAFYTPVSPVIFQKYSRLWNTADTKYLDQLGEYTIDKYLFQDFSWPENKNGHTLYLSHRLNNLPADRRVLYIVRNPDDQPIIEIFDFRK